MITADWQGKRKWCLLIWHWRYLRYRGLKSHNCPICVLQCETIMWDMNAAGHEEEMQRTGGMVRPLFLPPDWLMGSRFWWVEGDIFSILRRRLMRGRRRFLLLFLSVLVEQKPSWSNLSLSPLWMHDTVHTNFQTLCWVLVVVLVTVHVDWNGDSCPGQT